MNGDWGVKCLAAVNTTFKTDAKFLSRFYSFVSKCVNLPSTCYCSTVPGVVPVLSAPISLRLPEQQCWPSTCDGVTHRARVASLPGLQSAC